MALLPTSGQQRAEIRHSRNPPGNGHSASVSLMASNLQGYAVSELMKAHQSRPSRRVNRARAGGGSVICRWNALLEQLDATGHPSDAHRRQEQWGAEPTYRCPKEDGTPWR